MTKLSGVVIAALALSLGLAAAATPAAADGDAAKGKRVFNKCRACHHLEPGRRGVGPNLHGVFGRTAGTLEGYNYSADMKEAGKKGLVWNEETFEKYMANPKGYIGTFVGKKRAATRMPFAGLRKESDRENIYAYLKEATK